MLYHGIDLHKHSIVIGTFDDSGTQLASKRLRTRRADILSYLESMPGPHEAVVETTTGWYWLADLFREHDIGLKLAHAFRVKAISAAKVKTDTVDAATLAQLLWANLIPEAHMLDPELRPYRDLMRYCQLELILARLDVVPNKKTPEYRGFPSYALRLFPPISLKLTIPFLDQEICQKYIPRSHSVCTIKAGSQRWDGCMGPPQRLRRASSSADSRSVAESLGSRLGRPSVTSSWRMCTPRT